MLPQTGYTFLILMASYTKDFPCKGNSEFSIGKLSDNSSAFNSDRG